MRKLKNGKMFITLGVILMGILLTQSVVFAKNGDVIGEVYSTDILAKIDGLNAPSYNIGGRTAIVIEELADINSNLSYAINMKYDDSARRLDVTMDSSGGFFGEQYDAITRGKVGKVVGKVYETDIKVYFNGYEINGINIGGKTAVVMEELGQIGGINEEFGYSPYRCKATWDPNEKIIALDFIDSKNYFSVFDYGNSLRYTIKDNVMTAEVDRMAEYHSEIAEHDLTEEFEKEVNVLKPLYFDDGTEKKEVGFTYIQNDTIDNSIIKKLYITQPDLLKELTEKIHDGRTPTKEEAFAFLDDGVHYKTLGTLETEDFYVATVKNLKVDGEWNDISYVLIKKTGGYGKIYGGSTFYKERVIEKIGENRIEIGEGPTADPHGKPAILYCKFDLNNYFVK